MSAVEGWNKESLGAQLELIRNGYSGQQVDQFTNFPVSRIETISDGTINLNKVGYVDFIPDSYLLQSGDILFSNINSLKHIGKVAQVSEGTKLFHGMNLLVLRPVEEVDKKFLFYKLINAKPWFEKVAAQAINQASINQGTIKELRIELPQQKPEQAKIAEVLSTVDQAIEQTEALIAKQQHIKTGLMQDLLTRGIDEHGNLRSEQTHEFKDSPLGRIPMEWKIQRLGTLLANINQGWSPDCDSEPASIGEWGVLKTTSIVWQGYSDYENKALPERLKPKSSLEIISGNLLMTRAGPNSRVGVVAYVYRTRDKLMLSDKIYRLIPAENMEGRFLCYALSGFETQKHLSNFKTGMAESQTNISQEIVKKLLIVVPNKGEQVRIAERLDQISSVTKRSVEALEKLRSLKTALMQDLLTGKKRVTPLLTKPQETGA